jgi:5-methylcytosine-specific restriction endonuclease McrA
MEPAQRHVLVLNTCYTPLGVIPWETAISMWSTDKADIVEEYDEEVRSAYLTMRIPAVIRLRERVSKKQKVVKFSRINVYARDGYRCQYCGEHCSTRELTYDHVVPRSQGGKTNWTNIVSCCIECNSWKGGRTPEQAKMKLIKKPAQPSHVPEVTFQITQDTPEAWRDYLHWAGTLDKDE